MKICECGRHQSGVGATANLPVAGLPLLCRTTTSTSGSELLLLLLTKSNEDEDKCCHDTTMRTRSFCRTPLNTARSMHIAVRHSAP